MKNTLGPTDAELWQEHYTELEAKPQFAASDGSAQRREITCPHCQAKVVDNGKRDELTQDWIAECVCGWWRTLAIPHAPKADAQNSVLGQPCKKP